MKVLSKSILIMIIFDMLTLLVSTVFWYDYFNFPIFYGLPILFIVLTGLIVLFLKANYKIREFNNTFKNTYLLLEGVVFTNIPSLGFLFFADGIKVLEFFVANILTVFVVLKLYRILFHYWLFNIKKVKNILILGTDKRARVIADEIQGKKALRMQIAGFVEVNESEDFLTDNKTPVFKNVEDLAQIVEENDIDTVVIAQPTELITTVPKGVDFYKMPDFYEMATGKFYIDEKTITELYYQFAKNQSCVYDFCKRAYDIIAALIILIVTLPITGVTAIRIWLTDKESPIYTQTRIGIRGKEFKCYKLRTMYANNYVPKNLKDGGYAENQEQDDRVIPFCKFVRKARFDEIPQMINILKGEMSIVGPRAEWDEVVKIYKEQIPYYNCRMWVKTGWTGWAQINQGHCISSDDIAEKLQYDLYYLKNRNVMWEIFILVKAVFMALGGRHD
ncbi:MAG: exopolysaccharide biosynthesis polyprenyl glycosylphosphotransferase [Cyanobacteria bacterium SIG29]|nr:exopolysaccharide biosynthesis polyprenyl glycosylphosphotransferase [Cyanobacteria bacterium SIG29]